MKRRIAYFDNVKGVLILFIIFAHIISLTKSYYGLDTKILKIFSLFMVQCFFFISGYFSSKSHKSKLKKILEQAKIYIFWDLIITIYYAYVLNIIDFTWNIFVPRFSLWFLFSLLTYNVLEIIFDKVNYKVMIIISILIGLLSGYFSFIGRDFSLARTCTFIPFYVVGYYFKNFNIDIINILKDKRFKTIFILLGVFSIEFLLITKSYLSFTFLKGRHSYDYFSTSNYILVFKRFIFYLLSVGCGLGFLSLINNKENIFTWLGKNTLYIYLFQGVILKTFVHYKLLINNKIIGIIVLFIITLFLSIILNMIVVYIKKFISKGVNLWIKKNYS